KSTLMFSSNVHSAEIDVSTRSGVVTLTGNVATGAERALAIELAKNVRGVKNVNSSGLTI
ncbi:MAG: BON domain-containing protein, partial [Pseudomonadales bacterium]